MSMLMLKTVLTYTSRTHAPVNKDLIEDLSVLSPPSLPFTPKSPASRASTEATTTRLLIGANQNRAVFIIQVLLTREA
jgi:hypothetical protein